jgi:hypothetical protein
MLKKNVQRSVRQSSNASYFVNNVQQNLQRALDAFIHVYTKNNYHQSHWLKLDPSIDLNMTRENKNGGREFHDLRPIHPNIGRQFNQAILRIR